MASFGINNQGTTIFKIFKNFALLHFIVSEEAYFYITLPINKQKTEFGQKRDRSKTLNGIFKMKKYWRGQPCHQTKFMELTFSKRVSISIIIYEFSKISSGRGTTRSRTTSTFVFSKMGQHRTQLDSFKAGSS